MGLRGQGRFHRCVPWCKRFIDEEWLFGLPRQTLEELTSIGLFWDGGTNSGRNFRLLTRPFEMPFESRPLF
jgi:hypothetical protein